MKSMILFTSCDDARKTLKHAIKDYKLFFDFHCLKSILDINCGGSYCGGKHL